jgi:hypothetical protein
MDYWAGRLRYRYDSPLTNDPGTIGHEEEGI